MFNIIINTKLIELCQIIKIRNKYQYKSKIFIKNILKLRVQCIFFFKFPIVSN